MRVFNSVVCCLTNIIFRSRLRFCAILILHVQRHLGAEDFSVSEGTLTSPETFQLLLPVTDKLATPNRDALRKCLFLVFSANYLSIDKESKNSINDVTVRRKKIIRKAFSKSPGA